MSVETTLDRLAAPPQLNIAELFPAWQRKAACLGVGNERFFQESHGHDAKEICARCPVMVECLIGSMEENEENGIWGGCGEALRRGFRRSYVARAHEDPMPVAGCRCDWCRGVRRHQRRLACYLLPPEERHVALRSAPPININGPNARHARRATQAKGCRCNGCVWAASVWGQVATWLGVDTGEMWAETVDIAAAEGRTPRAVAEDRVEQLVSELVAALCSLAGRDAGQTRRAVTEGLERRRQVREAQFRPVA